MGNDPGLVIKQRVLEANEAFYAAFRRGDRDAMHELWSRHHPVACIHPGMEVLSGRIAVLASWDAVLRGSPPPMRCHGPVVQLLGSAAIVTCFEAGGDGPAHLACSNTFVLEGKAWKMVLHHAGPLQTPRRPVPDAHLN
jgi:hypothetical protein